MVVLGSEIGGRYRLEAVIGRGGMSTVYRALDTVLERPVAVKLMHSSIATDSAQLERFRREARLVAQLSHPNIVTVIDAGEEPEPGTHGDSGAPYIVFEYVEGETLKDLIRREGALEIPVALAYAVEIARALGAADERRLVHRDVKPQNILISSEGAAKITDFGIARPLAEEGLTGTGRVLASTDYVAPEQALGQPVSAQSDIYSLGVVLYEMLTGEVPFRGDSAVAVAMRHVREQLPDAQLVRPDLSAAAAAIVDRATMKDPRERYPDAAAMVADLEQALALEAARSGQASTGEVTSVLRTLPGEAQRRVPLRVRRPGAWIGAIAVLALVVGLALVFVAGRAHRGVGGAGDDGGAGLQEVSLGQSAAYSYNPFGTGPESPDTIDNVLDGDPSTNWSTEQYFDDTLKKANGTGTGLYLDAAPRVAAKAIAITTPTPGFSLQLYVADAITELPYGNATPLAQRGWHGPVGASSSVRSGQHIELHLDGASWRYYLLWFTSLPPAGQSITVSGVSLFKLK